MDKMHVVVATLILYIYYCSSANVEILKPKNVGLPDAALVIVPGAHISGKAYKPLARTIQQESNLTLWIALLDGFFNGIPSPLSLPGAFRKALDDLHQAGYKGNKAFLAGHSLGGSVTAQYGNYSHGKLDGILLFASYLPKGNPLTKYPVPVLTISGDLDGLTRVFRIMDTFEELLSDAEEDPMQIYRSPVIVMEGINHGRFASGKMPPNVVEHDLKPEVSSAEAYKTIAKYSDAFMILAKNDSSSNLEEARATLEQGHTTTAAIIEPLSAIKSLDQNPDYISHWTNTAQQLVVSLKNTTSVQFINHENMPPQQTPDVDFANSNTVVIESHTKVSLPSNPTDVSLSPLSPTQLKATMKSQAAVQAIIPAAGYGTSSSCKDINQEAFLLAFSKASTTAKSRYTSRGKPIYFLDDIHTSSEIIWTLSSLNLNYTGNSLNVTATRLTTSIHHPIKNIAGQNDCTLLAPLRALEWIYIDSLKQQYP